MTFSPHLENQNLFSSQLHFTMLQTKKLYLDVYEGKCITGSLPLGVSLTTSFSGFILHSTSKKAILRQMPIASAKALERAKKMTYTKKPKYIYLKMSHIQKAVSEDLCHMLFIPEKYALFAERSVTRTIHTSSRRGKNSIREQRCLHK